MIFLTGCFTWNIFVFCGQRVESIARAGRSRYPKTMADLLTTHHQQLEKFRGSMNLVGPGPVDFHFEDAKRALKPLSPEGYWADMGTGAGFPGLVFAALFPHVRLDLVDSRQKRCWFLNHVIHNAELAEGRAPLAVHCSRIEALKTGPYDGIMARALAKPEEVMNLTESLLRPGGRLVLLLQESQTVTPTEAFKAIAEHPYTITGKPRKTGVFQRL